MLRLSGYFLWDSSNFNLVFSEVTKNLVLRAEKAGFKAIALTVDTPMFGLRRADVRNKFTLPQHLKYVFYFINITHRGLFKI